ncbi:MULTISPECIES: hypothetical protein [Vagococcus]|nr:MULTISPECIES: hypothetical protein [Vagococcus]
MGFWIMISLLCLGLVSYFVGNKVNKRFNVFFKLAGGLCLLVSLWLALPR